MWISRCQVCKVIINTLPTKSVLSTISTIGLHEYLLPDGFTQVRTFIQFLWSLQFGNSSANLRISDLIRTSNCKFETIKNEIYTQLSYFLQLTCWLSDRKCVYIKYLLYKRVILLFDTHKNSRLKKVYLWKQWHNFRNVPIILNIHVYSKCTNISIAQF